MIRQYTRWLLQLKGKVETLRSNPQDLGALQDLQFDLLHKLKHVESLSKGQRRRTGMGANRHAYLLRVLRHFGDAITTIYISSWNLKQLSFQLDTGKDRHPPGFLSGKSGLSLEIDLLRYLIGKGIPAVLCDLTNNVRYGDVCLLGDSDPFVVECKLSPNKNRRVRRQLDANASLAAYFKTDRKTVNRGLVDVHREAMATSEVNHLSAFNEVLTEAVTRGVGIRTVETGLVFAAYSRAQSHPNERQLSQLKRPWAFCLNDYKNGDSWLSYRSFVDSIRDPDIMIKFIHDDVFAFVVMDVGTVQKIASRQGLSFEFDEGGICPFNFYKMDREKRTAEYMFALSIHVITRIALEFLSLRWVIEHNHQLFLSSIIHSGPA